MKVTRRQARLNRQHAMRTFLTSNETLAPSHWWRLNTLANAGLINDRQLKTSRSREESMAILLSIGFKKHPAYADGKEYWCSVQDMYGDIHVAGALSDPKGQPFVHIFSSNISSLDIEEIQKLFKVEEYTVTTYNTVCIP